MPKPPPQRAHPQDRGYKRLFSHKEFVEALICGYVDHRVAETFDVQTLERCNGSYITPDLRERRSDIVWRMRSANQDWAYVYLLIEFQSTVDRYMAVRLLGYIALLWQDLIAQQSLPPGGLLPVVLPIVLYNGNPPWTAPLQLSDVIATPPAALSHLQPDFSYHFLDENRVPASAGLRLNNRVSAIFSLEQNAKIPAQRQVVAALRSWLKERPDLREVVGTWYAECLAPTGLIKMPRNGIISLDEVESMMATRILEDIRCQVALGKAEGKAEGMVEGKLEGKLEGKVEGTVATIRQLVRSGDLPIDTARAHLKRMLMAERISPTLVSETLASLG